MKTGKLQLPNTTNVAKILNRNYYIIIIVIIVFAVINYDLFSSEPKYLITEGFFWKGIAIVFQLAFLTSIIQWHFKKRKSLISCTMELLLKGI
ncbi:hypothetical protein [uncultured Winogradskyella sp.]|uniref:hypothetical protein n=1 Tax=uncultured Winogradskyella sp. TaxID=395353 RepID=UPI002602857D|nr:hypothetical protein [uncultured Winogradskyella sp.]